ncbi:AraC family transcriptional regulator [Dechloromonas denitrificans]|uniref:AraC family transcriptional regulator n=1 Tax=Dechloromonas denitrificans TaxID=281362 RepID=A0A133XNP3_9RHOO|nr:AraC family ligand binding domain-containing protein [Dechloromonas denitrificans]KXB32557.1 AraC family transcriptional regulator [Dechloromonas denitrificans]
MTRPDFDDFRRQALTEGFDEVIERTWPPLTVLETHTHPFALKALVVDGEMWLSVGPETRHLNAGDTFELAREVPHAERYGEHGACYWVARRN